MRSFRLLVAGAMAATAVALPVNAAAPTAELGRYLVLLAEGQRASALRTRLTTLGITAAVGFDSIRSVAITGPRSAVDTLLRDGTAVSARAERRIRLHLASSVKYMGADRATLDEPRVHNTRGGKVTRPAVDGTGHTVAILDTGIADFHPDLQGQVTKHLNFELSHVVEPLLSADQLDTFAEATGPSAIPDDIGHGTHVAGIVAGTGAGAQKRYNDNRGVAPGAKLLDLRIAAGPIQGFYDDAGWERNAIAAFDWLLRHHKDAEFGANGVRLSTNSWGLTGTDAFYGAPDYEPLGAIIHKLNGANIITVFSAGNSGAQDKVDDKTVPNGLPQVISVAASCKPDAVQEGCDKPQNENDIANFSSRGPSVDIAAPGVEIVSAVSANAVGALGKACAPAELGPVPCTFYRGMYGGEGATQADIAANYALYGSLHGTSMAAPHVAGAVALILQANPKLTPTQVQMVLAGTARDRQAKGRDIEAGWGVVNVPAALVAATRLKKEAVSRVFPTLRWKSSL